MIIAARAISDGDLKTAIITIHALRGVAANIGANFILEHLSHLENLLISIDEKGLKHEQSVVDPLLQNCCEHHKRMMKAISDGLTDFHRTIKPKKSPLSQSRLILKLTQINKKLDFFDSSAIDDLKHIMEHHLESALQEELNSILNTANQYEFEHSSEQMRTLTLKLKHDNA